MPEYGPDRYEQIVFEHFLSFELWAISSQPSVFVSLKKYLSPAFAHSHICTFAYLFTRFLKFSPGCSARPLMH
jgi:hypothetical protein